MTAVDDRFADMRGYIEEQRAVPLASREPVFDRHLHRLGKLRAVRPGDSLLELGSGSGWLLALAAKRGLQVTGIEHNPELAQASRELAEQEGVEVDVRVGSVEDYPIEPESFDFVLATSVLEHVPDYRAAIDTAYRALRAGGVFHFNSTNKFAPICGEFPQLPLYGWLPYRLRLRIRMAAQGPDVERSGGIDANQFTYPGLRRTLRKAGFSRVLDLYELLEAEDLRNPTRARTTAMRAYKALPPLKALLTTFASGTHFYCVK
jgi:SAM-dependent methyltransferase